MSTTPDSVELQSSTLPDPLGPGPLGPNPLGSDLLPEEPPSSQLAANCLLFALYAPIVVMAVLGVVTLIAILIKG
tara:strand:+ start:533 stop:757 length:225 start_codon:yes stop_codon:yes gene_type:complete